MLLLREGTWSTCMSPRRAWSLDQLKFFRRILLNYFKRNFIALLFQTVVSCPVAPSMVLPAVDHHRSCNHYITTAIFLHGYKCPILTTMCKQIFHHAKRLSTASEMKKWMRTHETWDCIQTALI